MALSPNGSCPITSPHVHRYSFARDRVSDGPRPRLFLIVPAHGLILFTSSFSVYHTARATRPRNERADAEPLARAAVRVITVRLPPGRSRGAGGRREGRARRQCVAHSCASTASRTFAPATGGRKAPGVCTCFIAKMHRFNSDRRTNGTAVRGAKQEICPQIDPRADPASSGIDPRRPPDRRRDGANIDPRSPRVDPGQP